MSHYSLECIPPCLFFLHNVGVHPSSRSTSQSTHQGRSTIQLTARAKGTQANHRSAVVTYSRLHDARGHPTIGPNISDGMCLPGIRRTAHAGTSDDQKQVVARKDISAAGRRINSTSRPPEGQDGPRCVHEGQVICLQGQGRAANTGPRPHAFTPPNDRKWGGGQGGRPHNILRGSKAIGGGPTVHQGFRPLPTSNEGRHRIQARPSPSADKMGKEHAASRRVKGGGPPEGTGPPMVPSNSYTGEHGTGAHDITQEPPHHVPRLRPPGAMHAHQKHMGEGPYQRWGGPQTILFAQHQKDSSLPSPRTGLHRSRNITTWGMEISGLQTLYRHPH